ncbi:PAS domain S-box protein [Spirosoma sp. HMF4905]|uniref:histidine kinase n=1 Tax=Spirosoma arboris TaxID=2682092 RepID=A0A7K1SP85_9BACT|nr:PAS domain S-box protein [Spirosoma arboris]MVM35624.1 PAS domain S-box protein [Spirosoma arboris]
MSKQHQPDEPTPNQPAADDFQQVLESFVTATSDAVYRMSADWRQMHQLVGKAFLLDTGTTNSSWLEQYIPSQDQQLVQTVIDEAIAAKKPFELEHRVIRADGTVGWTFSRAIPLLNKQGEITEWFGTASNITDRKQVEEALAQSEEKYRTLFESIDEGVSTIEMIFDEQGRAVDFVYLEHNSALTRMTGMTAESIGKRASEVLPNMEPFWLDTYGRITKTGQPVRFEYESQDLRNNYFDIFASRVGGEGSHQVVVVYTNITQRKRKATNLTFLDEVGQDLARLTDIDQTMNALGEKIAAYLGLSACAFAELQDQTQIGVTNHGWHRSDMPSLLNTYRMNEFVAPEVLRLCQAGEAVVIRDVYKDPRTDGERYAALNIGSFVSIPLVQDGEWRFLLVVYRSEAHDWSEDEIDLLRELTSRIWTRLERARTEEAWRESQTRLSAVFTALPVGVGFTDNQGTLVLANHQMQRYLPTGLLPSRDKDRSMRWRGYDSDGSLIKQTDFPGARALRGEQVVPGIDMRYTQDDGTDIWTYVTAVPLFNDEGQITGQVSVVTDIDALKRAQDIVQASEGRLQRMVNVPGVGVLTFSREGRLLHANDAFLAIVGYSLDELTRGWISWEDFTPAEYLEASFQEFERVLTTGLAGPYEKEYFRKDGSRVWLMFVGADMGDGTIIEYAIDITDRKRAEEALRDSEDRLQLALKGAAIFTWEVDPTTSATRYSANFNEVLGFEMSTISDENFLHIYPDDKAFVLAAVGKALIGEAPLDVEHRIIHPQTGELIWVRAQGQLTRRSAEASPVLIGVTQNITTHKEAEDALRKLEQRNRLALEAAQMATWEWDLLTDQVYWNEQHFHLLGMAVQPNPLPAQAFMDHVHPDDVQSIQAHLEGAIAQRSLYDAEFRIVREDGVVRWMSGYGRAIAEQDSQPVRVSGVMFDITDRKEAQEALRANQERFRTLVQNLPDYAIFRIDPQGIITEWTEGAQRVKGYTAQEVIGQSIALFYTPEGLAAGELTTEMGQAAQQGRAERESVRIRKGGERFWVNEIMTAIHNGAGQLIGFTKISRDITERKAAERAIRDSQQRLQIVLDSIADHAIITTDSQSRITGWNPGAQQLFGYAAGEAIGQSFAILFTPEDRAAGEPQAELALARRESRAPDERYHVRKDGSRLYVSGVLSPLYEADGELLGYVKVARDLTQRRRMEQTLREADRRKDEFLAMLAHELRNPLAPIRNGLQILSLTSGTNPDLAPLVDLMSRQLTHLVRLVDDLLDVSRISQGKIELKRERLDLGTLVSGAVEAARPLYQARGQTLDLELPTTPLFVDGDATRLAQVVNNLLTNGSRYTGEDGRVRITLESIQDEAWLRVADNGIGLEANQLEAIFELFVQVDNSVARSQGGLGLGLTLVKRLVELHGGHIEVRSAGLGQGSEFSVYLPLLIEYKPQITMNEPTPHPAGQKPLLVIDDNADAALTLAMLLKLKGYPVHTRNSGRAGLEAAQQLQPAVILLDLGMPDLDGYETCRLLRQQPWGKAMPVIALTGYGQVEDVQRTTEAGFTAHLVKPVDLAALTQLLTQLMAGS